MATVKLPEVVLVREDMPRFRKVGQYTKMGALVREWDSQKEASRGTGVAAPSISACCNGNLKTAGGFRWSFR